MRTKLISCVPETIILGLLSQIWLLCPVYRSQLAHRAEMFYFHSAQKRVFGDNSTKLAHQLKFMVSIHTAKYSSQGSFYYLLTSPLLVTFLLHFKDRAGLKFIVHAQRVRGFSEQGASLARNCVFSHCNGIMIM